MSDIRMNLSRRELIAAFLGMPFASAGCSLRQPEKALGGAIVGQDVSLGHILREARAFDVPPDNWETKRVAIVGGGIAGLSAAWKLKNQDFHDFVVLELEKQAGGTSQSGTGTPVGYPWGAHYLPVPFSENLELVALLDEMSLLERSDGDVVVKEQYLCREPEERVFYKGRWYEGLYLSAGAGYNDRSQLADFNYQVDAWVNWRDAAGRRAFVVPVANCSDDAEVTALDKLSFDEWLRQKGFTSERLLWYCDYACRDDYGLKLEQTSAWAGLFYFCSRVRKSGSESQAFITFPEGNGRFVNHFLSKVEDHVRRSQAVVSIVPSEKGVDVLCLSGGTLSGIRCQKVIFASPIFTAPYLIRGLDAFPANEFQHNAWFVANLFLEDRPKSRFTKDFPLAWDNVLYESPSLGYVTATHQKGIDHGPTVLTYYYPMCDEPHGRERLFGHDWRDLADVCLADLGRAHTDIHDLAERIDIMRWGHAMISPRPNFIWSGIREKAIKPFRNIHFAHTDLSGIALFEEAFYHGLRAAREVLSVART
ncbi:MAG TPA: FAD-dependent oxidoreductase [Pyrinomonadaceae bacterium]|nr:FAD-dependent oxidoreductase [Pyrinomonadaceae bacterium]